MQTIDAESQESTDLEQRDVRALTEYMAVLPEGGDIYTVVGQNQNGEYAVDSRQRCRSLPEGRPTGSLPATRVRCWQTSSSGIRATSRM
jgi:hypothetical protein